MNLPVVTVVPGSETPTSEGVTGALRCVIVLPGGSRRAAVLKRGPINSVAAEAFCALVLRAWGLPVPEPFLVHEAAGPAFASADDGYPNLKQFVGVSTLPAGPVRDAVQKNAIDLAISFPTTPLAIACDEAIDNRDRNLGNILWDGTTEAWIDHAFAVGNAPSHLGDVNKLCLMAIATSRQDALKRGAVAHALTIDQSAPASAETVLSASIVPPGAMASYVSARVSGLASRILARFPAPADLLNPSVHP